MVFEVEKRMEHFGDPQHTRAGVPVAAAEQAYLRTELERRHRRLQAALKSSSPAQPGLSLLLDQVDAALSRIDNGTFGLCEICNDPIERDRLLADPLVRFCLDDLTSDERRALEHDLALAARIQRGLLPPQHALTRNWELTYHYQPAGLVSGDYCDYIAANRDLLVLCGDVSGKGVAASLLMSHLHATFRSLADADLPLNRMVEAANRIFLESTLAGQFATLVIGRASDDGTVELVNAGHVPILHLHENGASAKEATGVPLGMFSTAQFSTHRLDLRPGEGLLIYTDGLTEARNVNGDEYGIDRVKRFASRRDGQDAKTIIKNYLKDLESFQSGRKQADDLTLMVLRRVPADFRAES
jgi:sigma-B regulation protein RsbU (phosphoserine phosphatase)